MARGLARKMLAAAKADFEPDTACGGAEEYSGKEFALPGFGNGDAREEIIDEALLAR